MMYKTCWNTELLNNDIVCTFIEFMSTCAGTQQVKAFKLYLYDAIVDGRCSANYQQALQEDTLNKDLLVLPIHKPGPIGHWTIIGIYIHKKILVHLDSLLERNELVFNTVLYFLKNLHMINNRSLSYSDWILVSPKDIPHQIDALNCGFYVCINALSLMRSVKYSIYNLLTEFAFRTVRY